VIVKQELERYERAARCRGAAPALAALHGWAESVRSAELARVAGRLEGLTAEQAAAVEALTRRLTGKLLHAPSTCIRHAAGTSQEDWLAGLTADLLGVTA
jgi:glutamyl-tRNA reductase